MTTSDRRADDDRIGKILDAVNSLHTKMELISQTIEKEMKRDCVAHHKTLYDSENGLVKIVQIDHERVKLHSKIIWGIGGAVVVLLVNAVGKAILK